MAYKSSSISSKWLKTKWLLKSKNIAKHIPRTMLFNRTNLTTMVTEYSTVYFKPTNGSGGANIVRIKRKGTGYHIQYNGGSATYNTLKRLYDRLARFSKKRSYILQKGISLAKTNGKPFDIRVMVQKTKKGTWVSTALFTKIGHPKKVATNYNQGGKVGFFKQTMLGAGYNAASIQHKESDLKKMGVSVGQKFDHRVKGFKELGLDVALDTKGIPWILEVNTRPQFYPLKNMSNKTMYRRIVSYAKQYGRTK